MLPARDSSSDGSWDLVRSIRAKSIYSQINVVVAAVADRGCRSHLLQVPAFQKNRASAFHLVECPTDVTGHKVNATAAIDDHVRVQSEVACVECAVFDTIIQ